MIISERQSRHQAVIDAVRSMMTAARTAPKGRGIDIIECVMVEGEDIKTLSAAMLEMHRRTGRPVYERDSANILKAEAVLLIGTRSTPLGLNCAHCGYQTCASKPRQVPCAINAVDVGIAIGSAVSRAADLRVDTRVMFSIGKGAMLLDWLPDCGLVFGIPVSASSKNPFFDR